MNRSRAMSAIFLLLGIFLPAAGAMAGEGTMPPGNDAPRIAAISGVHEPHQGFALSAHVPSDRLCLELAQNLASELGIVVHVVCTDPENGKATVVAECGYADDPKSSAVESYSRGWGRGDDPFLICVPPDRDRFRATRIEPEVRKLRPSLPAPGS